MGKTKISPRKLVTSRGIFHAKMGMINDRNSKDLTEAKDIKRRWQEYTENLYRKVLMTQITMMV